MNKKAIIIVAHPDDEVLFFSTILDNKDLEKHVICITDGNADGRGKERDLEFKKCMEFYKIRSFEKYNFPDKYDENLDSLELETCLKKSCGELVTEDTLVFTHGPFGDYGHPHHITTSYVVHKSLNKGKSKIYTPNVLEHPNGVSFQKESMQTKVWERKLEVLCSIYKEEYKRFVSLVPARASESFILSNSETYNILEYLINDKDLKDLSIYLPYKKSLELFKDNGLKRKF